MIINPFNRDHSSTPQTFSDKRRSSLYCSFPKCDSSNMDPKARVRSIIIMAFITCFLDCMNNALIVPILPYLVDELNSTSMEEGILFSSYSIFQLISMELQFLIIV